MDPVSNWATVNLCTTPNNSHNAVQYLNNSRPDYGDAFEDLLKTTPLEALQQWRTLVQKNYNLPAEAPSKLLENGQVFERSGISRDSVAKAGEILEHCNSTAKVTDDYHKNIFRREAGRLEHVKSTIDRNRSKPYGSTRLPIQLAS